MSPVAPDRRVQDDALFDGVDAFTAAAEAAERDGRHADLHRILAVCCIIHDAVLQAAYYFDTVVQRP